MKKLAALVLSLILVFSLAFSNVAIAETGNLDFVTYGNSNAILIVVDNNKALLVNVTPNATVDTYVFENIRLCAFKQLYFSFIGEQAGKEDQYIWFFQGNENMISLEGYTPIFFDEDAITLKKGDTYYEVDMEKTASTGELVVNPLD